MSLVAVVALFVWIANSPGSGGRSGTEAPTRIDRPKPSRIADTVTKKSEAPTSTEAASIPKDSADSAIPSVEVTAIGDILSGQTFSIDQVQNRGTEKPAAALETFLWAAREGDVASLANLLTYGVRREAAFKADSVRQIIIDSETLSKFRIGNVREYGPEALLMTVECTMMDGRISTDVFLLKKIGNTWHRDLYLGTKK